MIVLFLSALLVALVLYTYLINTRLKNFPKGPISLPLIGGLYCLGTEPHKTLQRMKAKYGSIIRIDFGAYNGIVLNDYKVIKEALNLPEFNSRPEYAFIAHIRNHSSWENEGTIFVNGNVGEEQRKFIFDYLRIMRKDKNAFEVTILEQLESLKKHLNASLGQHIESKNMYNTAAVAPMWTVLTGTKANNDERNFKICVDLMTLMADKFSSAGAVYFMPTLCKMFPSITGWTEAADAGRQNIDFVNNLLRPFISSFSPEKEPTTLIEEYLSKIKSTDDRDSSFFGATGDNNLRASVWDVLLAGTETVSTAMAWFQSLITFNQDAQQKMQNEIDETLKGRLPNLDDRASMPYTVALVHEVLRFSALSPLSSPRATGADVVFRGYFIPKGTIVVPNLYAALYDPELWDEPESFMPERFLSKDGTTFLKDKASLTQFVFGSGKRGCPGNSLAKDQMFLLGVGLLQQYKFFLDPKVPNQKLETHLGGTLTPKSNAIIVSRR